MKYVIDFSLQLVILIFPILFHSYLYLRLKWIQVGGLGESADNGS